MGIFVISINLDQRRCCITIEHQTDRLSRQMAFLNEIEKLKSVYRRNKVVDGSRFENSAEHSWHVAMMALVLFEHRNVENTDLVQVVKMLLVHDLVEIYAGDTWLYDAAGAEIQAQKERAAAEQLFALLPADQKDEFRRIWEEFEVGQSPEAVYARSIDALQPLTNHLLSGQVDNQAPRRAEVMARKLHIADGSTLLWSEAQSIIEQSTQLGLYNPDLSADGTA